MCVLYSMSTTIAGSWTNGNLNPNTTYWGLTRVVGPSDTTRADIERNKSMPGKFYSNASNWFTPMNPSIQNERTPIPRSKWVDQDNGVFLKSVDFQAPIGYRIPRISPRGKGGKRVLGAKGTGNHTPRLGVSDNESAEVGSLGREGDVVQPARKQDSPMEKSPGIVQNFVKADKPQLVIDTSLFKPNSAKGSPVTSSAGSSFKPSKGRPATPLKPNSTSTPSTSSTISLYSPESYMARRRPRYSPRSAASSYMSVDGYLSPVPSSAMSLDSPNRFASPARLGL